MIRVLLRIVKAHICQEGHFLIQLKPQSDVNHFKTLLSGQKRNRLKAQQSNAALQ